MSKIEYDNFPKFIVSFGIILIALPFIAMHFFLQENSIILISENEILELTYMAKQIIMAKQKLASFVTDYILVFSIFCILCGVLLLFLGCRMWYIMQKKLDDKQDIELKTAKIQLEKMSPNEKDEKMKREIIEMEQQYSHNSEEKDITLSIEEIRAKQNAVRKENSIIYKQISKRYSMVEENLLKALHYRFKDTYDTQGNVKIKNLEYDAVLISKNDNTDLIFEIKYTFSSNSWNSFMWRDIPYRMKEQIEIYTNETKRKAMPILLIVTVEDQIEALKKSVERRLEDCGIIIKILPENDVMKIDCLEKLEFPL